MDVSNDLIVDVARAADPERAAAMAQRLAKLDASADPATFADVLATAGAPAPAPAPSFEPAVDARKSLADPAQFEAGRAAKARQQFEATLLNSFVSEMMPKDTTSAYGGGYAGDMWRSLLSEKIAEQIAKSGVLGIANRLFANGNSPALQKLRDASATAESEASLAAGPKALIDSGAYLFTRDKAI